jgi:hypothetical protein
MGGGDAMSSPRTGLEANRFTDTFVTPTHPHMHMPRAEFLRLLNFCGFQCCHLCGRKSYLLVDHSHKTHLIRGLLCDTCNRLVGRYESGWAIPNIIKVKITAYLDNPPCEQLGMRYEYLYYYEGQKQATA